MTKVRTAIGLTQATYDWLKQEGISVYGDMSEYVESMITRDRSFGPIEQRLKKQADRLEAILNAILNHA